MNCPRCNKDFEPKSIGDTYVCPLCGAFMPRHEDEFVLGDKV